MSTVGKMKDSTTCRVFYSSPFNGMEGEREELTRRYWPQLASACSAVGVRFTPVDMRWGITTDQSANNQTINICLREIDRSDLFVGFFGQRYGWQGLQDRALQMTFDAAVPGYPWLQQFRDRSVTELEFLHGHLNEPGKIPAIICFRDKAYDDRMRAKGEEKKDTREIYKYSPESDQAVQYMSDLIARVKATEEYCLAVQLAYKDPAEGARIMFEHTWKYIQDVVIKQTGSKQTVRQTELSQHSAYLMSHCQQYHGDPDYIVCLNEHVCFMCDRPNSEPLLVVGEAGSGKSALLCNWIQSLQRENPECIYLYHFVECSSHSSSPRNVLQRMVSNLRHELEILKKGEAYGEVDPSDFSSMTELDLLNEWQKHLQTLSAAERDVVIVIDELQKVQYKEKIVRPLFWLPKSLPPKIHVIVSTDSSDSITLEELVQTRGYNILTIHTLSEYDKLALCRETLLQRGKALSENQLATVLNANNTSNPMFLKLVLEELCMFGKFRELDQKIESLVTCSSTKDLFEKLLERLENDYGQSDYNGNLAEKVMGSLYVTRHGLRESDLMELHHIPSHVWTPFYYAVEQHLGKMTGGFLNIAQSGLRSAVFKRYVRTKKNETSLRNEQIEYLQTLYDKQKKEEVPIPEHIYTELPWLCLKAENKTKLASLVTSMQVFTKLNNLQQYELLEYVDFLKCSSEELIDMFDKAVNIQMVNLYMQQQETELVSRPNVGQETIQMLGSLESFFHTARKVKVHEFFLKRMKKILETNTTLSLSFRNFNLNLVTYKLACLYIDTRRHVEALPMHESVIDYYKKTPPKTDAELELFAKSLHGAGTAYNAGKKYSKTEECFNESIKIHRRVSHLKDSQLNICASLSSLAQLQSFQGKFELAREKFEEVVRMEEDIYRDTMPPEMSYTMTNLGICYRRLNEFEKAEEVYKKALKIKLNAVGPMHFDVAYAYFNLSNLARDRELYDEALGYLRKTLEIFEKIDYVDSADAINAKENVALIYMQQKKMDEGFPYFWDVFNYHSERNQLGLGLKVVFDNYLIHLLRITDHDRVRIVAKAMIHCESMQSFLPFLFLHYVDNLKSPGDGSFPKKDETIDHAIELYPDNKSLVIQKIELDLIPMKNITAINNLLQTYNDNAKSIDELFVVQVADLLEEKKLIDGAIVVYEHWLRQSGRCESYLRNLAVAYAKTQQLDKSLKMFQRAVDVNPTDPILREKVAYLSLRTGDVETCKAAIKELEAKWSDNEALMKQVRRYKDEIVKLESKTT